MPLFQHVAGTQGSDWALSGGVFHLSVCSGMVIEGDILDARDLAVVLILFSWWFQPGTLIVLLSPKCFLCALGIQ